MTDYRVGNNNEVVEPQLSDVAIASVLVGQGETISIDVPDVGQTVTYILSNGQIAVLNFEAAAATPSLESGDFVLSFDSDGDGNPDSRIVFENLVQAAQEENAPVLVIGGVELSTGLLIGQAQALTNLDAFETAAGNGPIGSGGSTYDDNLGSVIDLLNAQGVIDPTQQGANLSDDSSDILPLALEGFLSEITGESRNNVPVITVDGSADVLEVPESALNVMAIADFSDNFTVDYGADGAGSVSYALSVVNGTDSGVIDTKTGQSVYLYLEDGDIVGRVGDDNGPDKGGVVVFRLYDNENGEVVLVQLRPLAHEEDGEIISLSANVITLTATATDSDGDKASESIGLGSNIRFKDDGPAINAIAVADTLEVSESRLNTNSTVNFSDNFSLDFGADDIGSFEPDFFVTLYALSVVSSTDSGVIDTETGLSVYLYAGDNGEVIGRVGGANGHDAFTLSVDQYGWVTLNQLRPLDHGDSDIVSLNADVITLTATIKDGDGDTDSESIGLGSNIRFKDDIPEIKAINDARVVEVSESNLGKDVTDRAVTKDFSGDFRFYFGADGLGVAGVDGMVIHYELELSVEGGTDSGVIDAQTSDPIYLYQADNGDIVGRVGGGDGPDENGEIAFIVSVSGYGRVTLDQLRPLAHEDRDTVSLSDGVIALTATVADGDGDKASAEIKLGENIRFKGDIPEIKVTNEARVLEVDESDLSKDAVADFSGDTKFYFGADGIGEAGVGGYVILYELELSVESGVDSGVIDTETSDPIYLYQVKNGDILGRVGGADGADENGAVAFTLSVSGTGRVTLDQLRPLDHGDSDTVSLSDGIIALTTTVADSNGDKESARIDLGSNIRFKDDSPSGVNDVRTLDEGDTVRGNVLTNDDSGNDGGLRVYEIRKSGSQHDTELSDGVLIMSGEHGKLTINPDGSYSYEADTDLSADQQDVFVYTIQDSDGDEDEAYLTFNLENEGDCIMLDPEVNPRQHINDFDRDEGDCLDLHDVLDELRESSAGNPLYQSISEDPDISLEGGGSLLADGIQIATLQVDNNTGNTVINFNQGLGHSIIESVTDLVATDFSVEGM